jgi:hypothetical protein
MHGGVLIMRKFERELFRSIHKRLERLYVRQRGGILNIKEIKESFYFI